jgi:hypothetical protein
MKSTNVKSEPLISFPAGSLLRSQKALKPTNTMICEVFCCPDAAKHSLQSKVEVRD